MLFIIVYNNNICYHFNNNQWNVTKNFFSLLQFDIFDAKNTKFIKKRKFFLTLCVIFYINFFLK